MRPSGCPVTRDGRRRDRERLARRTGDDDIDEAGPVDDPRDVATPDLASPASRSASTSRWRRTAPCRAERRSRTWAASSNRCWAARRDIRAPSASAITDGSPVSARAAASHRRVVRHAVGEPGARALGDAELRGATRHGIGRRDMDRPSRVEQRRNGNAEMIASTTRTAIVRDGSGPRWTPVRAGSRTTASRGHAESVSSRT